MYDQTTEGNTEFYVIARHLSYVDITNCLFIVAATECCRWLKLVTPWMTYILLIRDGDGWVMLVCTAVFIFEAFT